MENHFQGRKENPFHISVGAILVNEKKEVCCHYFKTNESIGGRYPNNFYILMRESLEDGESLEQALHRGLQEEFSATATFERYVGSIVFNYQTKDTQTTIEKTTLYFLCKLIEIKSERKADDPEAGSEIKWLQIDELISIMKDQGQRLGWGSDESKVLESAKVYLQ